MDLGATSQVEEEEAARSPPRHHVPKEPWPSWVQRHRRVPRTEGGPTDGVHTLAVRDGP